MTRVLHVGKFYPPVPGGMERVLELLCRATSERLENGVLAFDRGRQTRRETMDGVAVTRVGTMAMAGSVPIAPGFRKELKRAAADLIVLHEPNPWALMALASLRLDAPLAIWYHSEVSRPRLQYALFYHPLVRAVYRRARRIVVSSPELARHARALQPYSDRIEVVPFGIDAAAWRLTPSAASRAAAIRSEAGGRPLVLFAGRMVPYKGVDVLLRAMRELDAACVLAGSGPGVPGWMALASQIGVADRVRFAGDVSAEELLALYHACDVFVLPSVTRAEAFGYVQLEAMACGKPIVSTRVASGVPWVNRNGETGLTVEPGNPGALRAALLLLLQDGPLRARLGAGGLARVHTTFTLRKMGDRATAVFEAAASEGRSA